MEQAFFTYNWQRVTFTSHAVQRHIVHVTKFMHICRMTIALTKLAAQVECLSALERAELRNWLAEYEAKQSCVSASEAKPWPDLAARLKESWGDAPAMTENTVLALREEESF